MKHFESSSLIGETIHREICLIKKRIWMPTQFYSIGYKFNSSQNIIIESNYIFIKYTSNDCSTEVIEGKQQANKVKVNRLI